MTSSRAGATLWLAVPMPEPRLPWVLGTGRTGPTRGVDTRPKPEEVVPLLTPGGLPTVMTGGVENVVRAMPTKLIAVTLPAPLTVTKQVTWPVGALAMVQVGSDDAL